MCPIGILTLHLEFPGCDSLKAKRSRVKPILARLHREFNVSAAEIGLQDLHQETRIACVVVANDAIFLRQFLQNVIKFVEDQWRDSPVLESKIEVI